MLDVLVLICVGMYEESLDEYLSFARQGLYLPHESST